MRAGHKPWPRLFQNLRGSCETDWVDDYPSHQVASWLGHSPLIAVKHYLKHKDLNVQAATGRGIWIKKSNAESNAQVTQNTTQHPAAPVCPCVRTACYGQNAVLQPYDLPVTRGGQVCKTLQSETMGEEGFELVKETTGNSDVFKTSGAECGADTAGWHIPTSHPDHDLKQLIEGWSALPLEIRSGILLIASSCKSS